MGEVDFLPLLPSSWWNSCHKAPTAPVLGDSNGKG